MSIPVPKKIIYNGPATVVFWTDGTKTVVKKAKGQRDDKYSAFCSALAIKLYGSNSAVKRRIRHGEEGRPRLLWERPKEITTGEDRFWWDRTITTNDLNAYCSRDYIRQFAIGKAVRVISECPQSEGGTYEQRH